MKSTLGSFDLHWLIAPGAPSATPVDDSLTIHRMDFQIPSEVGSAWLESLELNEGLKLYRAVHHLERAAFGAMLPMLDVTSSEPEQIFSAQTWLSGIGCHLEYWHGRTQPPMEVWGRPGLDTFRLRTRWDARVLIAGAGVTEMRSLIVSQSMMLALLGNHFDDLLLKSLGLDEATKTVTRQMPQHLTAPLQEALSDQYTGPARRLFAQTKTLEYLSLLVEFLHAEKTMPRQGRHAKKIRDLKEYLLTLDGRIPALNSLAADFGLSAKQLNIEFKAEFGQSIFDYVTTNRLEQAHAGLLASSVPMKALSDRLGYSHVNHFITAFKRKFGYPPGSLRRKRKAA